MAEKRTEMKNDANAPDRTVAIVGIGRVGLPLALSFCEAGYRVFGIDVRPDYIELLNQKKLPFIENGALPLLEKHVGKNFFPTTDASNIRHGDYIILTLGTPVDEHLNPDYNQLHKAMTEILPNIRESQTIILRSTVAPGTTEYLKDLIEKETKMKIGTDLFLAFCPERIAEGYAIEEIREIPQIIGGIDTASTERAVELFKSICGEQLRSDARSAELAKIFTNMYRYINFSIANEFMILAEENNCNIYDIIHLINHNYKRGGVKMPGFTAGPCLYKDGFFLINEMPFSELISVSWKINETTPLYLLKKIKEKISLKNRKVALLGLAFKADIDDTRNSLSFKIKKALLREHAVVEAHDPFVKEYDKPVEEVLKGAEVVIVGINHSAYKQIGIEKLRKLAAKNCIVCDIWNVFGQNRIIFET